MFHRMVKRGTRRSHFATLSLLAGLADFITQYIKLNLAVCQLNLLVHWFLRSKSLGFKPVCKNIIFLYESNELFGQDVYYAIIYA